MAKDRTEYMRAYMQAYREKNKERLAKYRSDYSEKNRERIREYNANYYLTVEKERRKERRQANEVETE